MDYVRGVRIHCKSQCIIVFDFLYRFKAFFFLLRRRRAPCTVHCVLQWILTPRPRGGHRGHCFTIESDLRLRTACILQLILNVGASNSFRSPKNKSDGGTCLFFCVRKASSRAPSKSEEYLRDSAPHVRNLINVSRIMLLAGFVLARLSCCSFWCVFRIR